MSLTRGTGPFREQPADAFDVAPDPPEHVLCVESTRAASGRSWPVSRRRQL